MRAPHSCKALLLALLFVFSVLAVSVSSGEKYRDIQVPEEDSYLLSFYDEDQRELKYDVYVTQGSQVDIYLLDEEGYQFYDNNQSFTPLQAHENRTLVTDSYRLATTQHYYLVVDNRDNGRKDDTRSQGNVTVDITVQLGAEGSDWNFPDERVTGFYVAFVLVAVLFIYMRWRL